MTPRARFPKPYAATSSALPVPKTAAQGTFAYDYPDDDRGEAVQLLVKRKTNGRYYCWTPDYDFEVPTEPALQERLRKLEARHVGYESDDE